MKSKRQRTAELLNELRPCRGGYTMDRWRELVTLLAPRGSKAIAFGHACYGRGEVDRAEANKN